MQFRTAADGQYSCPTASAGDYQWLLAEAEEACPALPWREYALSRHPRKRQCFRSEAASPAGRQRSSRSAAAFPLDRVLKAPTAGVPEAQLPRLGVARSDPVTPESRFPFHRRAARQPSKCGIGSVSCAPQAPLGSLGAHMADQAEDARSATGQQRRRAIPCPLWLLSPSAGKRFNEQTSSKLKHASSCDPRNLRFRAGRSSERRVLCAPNGQAMRFSVTSSRFLKHSRIQLSH